MNLNKNYREIFVNMVNHLGMDVYQLAKEHSLILSPVQSHSEFDQYGKETVRNVFEVMIDSQNPPQFFEVAVTERGKKSTAYPVVRKVVEVFEVEDE